MRNFLFISLLWLIALPSLAFKADKKTIQQIDSDFVTEYLTPVRIVWLSDKTGRLVKNSEQLLEPFSGQASVNNQKVCILKSVSENEKASLLLDFGKEIQGGIQLVASIRDEKQPINVRVRFGESVSEAMSEIRDGATNDHAVRDFRLPVPWLGSIEVGNTGFRFVRIDLEESQIPLLLNAIRAVSKYRDIPYLGSFKCDNERLNKIWQVGAYTVHLNMQNYLWDGIKRDRLVWLGDLHPEVMAVTNVFGEHHVVNKTLDFAKEDTPLPGWINGMSSYSLWWVIIQRDLYLYRGNKEYLETQRPYLIGLLNQILSKIASGKETLDGVRFLDWPTSENPDIIHSGLQSLMMITMKAGIDLCEWLDEPLSKKQCQEAFDALKNNQPSHCNNKQAIALSVLADDTIDRQEGLLLANNGAQGFSTFYGYYMLEALAKCNMYEEAMQIISDYWGGMLDLGATTFWEDLTYEDLSKATRIDELVPEGKYDIHANGGAYCYKGYRHSFCHGWASGPTSWLTQHVLGVKAIEPGCKTIEVKPHMGSLKRVEGTFPTPYGIVKIEHIRLRNGKIKTKIDAPKEIKVIQ